MASTIDLEELIQLDDGDYEFVERVGNIFRLRNRATKKTIDITRTQIASRSVDHAYPNMRNGLFLDRLAEHQADRVTTWADHLTELITGTHPNLKEPRADYALTRPMRERVASKAAELQAQGVAASPATIYRKLNKFHHNNAEGLVDGRSKRTYNPLQNADADVVGALEYVLAATGRSTGTMNRTINEAKAELRRRQGSRPTSMPSLPTWYKYLRILCPDIKNSAKRRQNDALRRDHTYTTAQRSFPGQECQIDTNTLDVQVIARHKKDGTPVLKRPMLSIMIDVCSRSVIAYTFRLDATKGVDHVDLLLQSMTPRENRPSRHTIREMVIDDYPEISFLSAEERARHELAMPFVKPRRIMMDNGADYRSQVFLSAARHEEVDITYASPGRPEDKAHVERMFRTINTLFTEYLVGHTGNSPENRGSKSATGHLLTLDALVEYFDDWIISEWQNRPHSELRDRFDPTFTLTPNQKYEASSDFNKKVFIPYTRDNFIALLPSEFRVIDRDGIRRVGFQYDSEALHDFRGKPSAHHLHQNKWEVKYDPYNPAQVWIANPDGGWIEAKRKDWRDPFAPHFPSEPTHLDQRALVAMTQSKLQGVNLHIDPAESLNYEPTTSTGEPLIAPDMPAFDPDKD